MDTIIQRWDHYKRLLHLVILGVLSSSCSSLWAAGFQLIEQNVNNLGTAYAGAVSEGANASTGYYNPAALTRIRQEQIAGSVVLLSARTKLNATSGSSTFPGQPAFNAIGQAQSKNLAYIPALHYAKRLNDCWVFAFNIASPFGLKNNFKNDSIVRYMATRSELTTIDLSPSLGYDFQNGFSLGAGVDALYVSAKLDTRLGNNIPGDEGFIENTASRWGLGYHVGALYEFTDCTRVGAQYRSKVKVSPRGQSTLFSPAQVILSERIQGVGTKITLPETATLSIYHQMNTQWALMSDVQWTHWKRFRTLALGFADGRQSITPENFRDSVRVSAGLSYQSCDPWLFKVGTAFDKTPVRDIDRTVRIPDQNRIWAALGAQYRLSKNLSIDMGYAHLFFKKANINEAAPRAVPITGQTLQSLRASSKSRADLIGIQLTWDLV